MSDDNWLQSVRKKWSKQGGECSDFLHYLTDHQETPGPVPDEPCVIDMDKHYLTLSWKKPLHIGGAPIMAYRVEKWLVGEKGGSKWIEVGMTPTTSLDVYSLTPGERYNFRVSARNQYGWGPSVVNNTPILFEEATEFPQFEKCLPGELKVLFDSSVELECQLKRSKDVEIGWSKDGSPIFEGDKYKLHYSQGRCCLTMKNLKEDDSGRYVCEAFNKHGKICTFVRLMIVHDQRIVNASLRLNRLRQENDGKIDMAPQFSMRLRDRRIQMCYPVRLTCQIRGYPRPCVVWYKDGGRIEDDQNFSTYEESDDFYSLEINDTRPEHGGTYSIVATNSSGRVSSKCDLLVDKGLRTYIGPKFVDKLDRLYTVQEGSQLRLRAVVCAYPAVGVTWQKNGIRLRQSRRVILTVSHQGEVELTIARMSQLDNGIYTCVATNEAGRAETNTRIEVHPKPRAFDSEKYDENISELISKEPKFLVKPLSFKVSEGDHVVIECKIVADPKPTVSWLRDRLKLDYYRDSDEFKILNEESAPFEYKLEIARAKFDHTGAYTVTASNEHGEIKAVVSLQVQSQDPMKLTSKEVDRMRYSEVQKVPKIKRPLSDIKCCDGDSVTFECETDVEGDCSKLNFRWYKNGKLIQLGNDFQSCVNGNTASLIIEQVYAEDEGQYSCIVSNDLGEATSTACLIVNVHDEKENQIHRQLDKPKNLQSRSESPALNILVPLGRDNLSSERTLSTTVAAKFQTLPISKVVEEGDTVRFQCTVIGNPPPSTKWDKFNVPVCSNERIHIREEDNLRILEITNVVRNDEGLYRIVIENEHGRCEATARLDIICHRKRSTNKAEDCTYEKHHGRHTVGKVANAGAACAVSCQIPDSSFGGSATWYKNGEKLALSSNKISKNRDSVFQLQMNALSLQDSGVYTCILENEFGKTRCSAELIVVDNHDDNDMSLRPPIFIRGIPQKVYANEGKSFELRIKLQGEDPIHVAWFKNDDYLPDCDDFEYMSYGDGEFGLRLKDTFSNDTGLYRCEAYNCHGDAQTQGHLIVRDDASGDEDDLNSTVKNGVTPSLENVNDNNTLDIFHEIRSSNRNAATLGLTRVYNNNYKFNDDSTPATVIEGPQDKTVMRGESVTLTVKYFGNPDPVVRWTKAGREIKPNNRIKFNTGNGESNLHFEAVTGDDGGKYEISVENEFGSDTHSTSLAVEGSPEAPNGRPNVVSSNRSVTVTWCSSPYDGGSKITGYTIEMRSFSSPQWRTVVENCNSLFCTVCGLIPGESYLFRVRAENGHGSSAPSGESLPAYVTHADVCSPLEQKHVTIQNSEIFANRYEILEELGKGRFGVVHKIREKEFGNFYAAKIVRCITAKDKDKVREEIEIMNILRHPKLLQLISASENSKEIIMVTEYIEGGELFERVVADDFTLTERDCIEFMKQICDGVAYIHKNNVVHLDLKPENIMCVSRSSHKIKLIDFGLAQKISPETPVRVLFGTPEFIPPEILNYEPIGTETDMWAVGVICYVLLSGLSPFMGQNHAETFANITRAEFDFDDETFGAISQDAKDFISALLVKRKEKRLTAKQCLQHKWLAQHDKTMYKVKLCTDKLKAFIMKRKWQKAGNAFRALQRMITLSADSRRSSSGNSTSSLSGSYSSRVFSLSEDDNILMDNSVTNVVVDVDAKMFVRDERDDAKATVTLKAPIKHVRKTVAFKDVDDEEAERKDVKIADSKENGKLDTKHERSESNEEIKKPTRRIESFSHSETKLNGETEKTDKTASPEVINVPVEHNDNTCEFASNSGRNSSVTTRKTVISTIGKNSVSDLIGKLKETSSVKSSKASSSTGSSGVVASGNVKRNNYFNLNRTKLGSAKANNDEGNRGNVSTDSTLKTCKVESSKTKSAVGVVNQNKYKIKAQSQLSIKDKITDHLVCDTPINTDNDIKLVNETSKLSDTAKSKTAQRLKQFEQLSSARIKSSSPSLSKSKKESAINKSNCSTDFKKRIEFWNK